MEGVPSSAQLLGTLLAVESFLLAVVSLAVALSNPVKGGVRDLLVSPRTLAYGAAGLLTLAAAGAALAWIDIFCGGGDRLPFPQFEIAIILAIVIGLQPVFAFLVATGTRFEE